LADTNNTSTALIDELAALDPARRRELAAALRSGAETLAEVRDGQTTAGVLGVLARCSNRPRLADLYPKRSRNRRHSRRLGPVTPCSGSARSLRLKSSSQKMPSHY